MKSCFPNLTASGQRVCTRFEAACGGDELSNLGHLVFALLAEESIGGACLTRLGLTMDVLASGAFGSHVEEVARGLQAGDLNADPRTPGSGDCVDSSTVPDWYVVLRDRAAVIAKRSEDGPTVSSEHLVMAMTEIEGFPQSVLKQLGIEHEDVIRSLEREDSHVESLKVDLTLKLDGDQEDAVQPASTEGNQPRRTVTVVDSGGREFPKANAASANLMDDRVYALLDANLNRVREGLRVLEDSARFILCHESTTEVLKGLRHQLVEEELRLRANHPLIGRRDVVSDAGTELTTPNEKRRVDLRDVLTANCRRMQEALRSLEEFSKLVDTCFSEACKQIRYQTYEAEQRLEVLISGSVISSEPPPHEGQRDLADRRRRLQASLLYILLTERLCQLGWKQTAQAVLQAGAGILQLREKDLSPPELLRRSLWLRDLCLEHGALFIVNDDAGLAASCRADGVHIGQTDASVEEARSQLNSDQLLGLSTHNLSQLNLAADQKVDYLGIGPMFPTGTKAFESYSGPAFAAEAAQHALTPWFAIGGINDSNLQRLISCGVRRIAVCGAVIGCDRPEAAVHDLLCQLKSAERTQ